jgi:hypothetical protein
MQAAEDAGEVKGMVDGAEAENDEAEHSAEIMQLLMADNEMDDGMDETVTEAGPHDAAEEADVSARP